MGAFTLERSRLFDFLLVPKLLFVNEKFKDLSNDAKLLYSLFLERFNLCEENNWIDDNDIAYIYYPIQEIQEDLGFSKPKTINLVKELEAFNLVKIKRQEGNPNKFYLVDFGSFIS